MAWVIVLFAVLGVGYGALDLIAPRTTYRWQVRSTARHPADSLGHAIGTTTQHVLGVTNPDDPPDATVLRRIRTLGVLLIVFSSVFATIMLYAVR